MGGQEYQNQDSAGDREYSFDQIEPLPRSPAIRAREVLLNAISNQTVERASECSSGVENGAPCGELSVCIPEGEVLSQVNHCMQR